MGSNNFISLDVSVIIVSYNTKDITLACLESVYTYSKYLSFEVIVVDNASRDDSVLAIKEKYPETIIIQSDVNLGFGKANNLGSKISKGKYVFLLNSDTILLNNALKYFYDFMEGNLDVGAVGCKLLDANYHYTHSFGLFPSFKRECLYTINTIARFLGTNIDPFHEENYLVSAICDVDYITGADLFIRKSALETSEIFDSRFFMYFEETDFQFRLKERGFRRCIISDPLIIHLEGGSFDSKVPFKRFFYLEQSKLYYFSKRYSSKKYVYFRIGYFLLRLLPTLLKKYTVNEKKEYLKLLMGVSVG